MITNNEIQTKEQIRYESFILKGGLERSFKNLILGRAIKPCGKECEEYGYKIVTHFNHESFQNFKDLMNDIKFLLNCAKLSPNPMMCECYFYNFINNNLKRNKAFRLEFLKSIYLNENVYTPESIMWFVENFKFEKENKKILSDLEFKKIFAKRLDEQLDYPQFHLDGNDRKKVRQYKDQCNFVKTTNQLRQIGIIKILSLFAEDKLVDSQNDYNIFNNEF